jgi:hypothetical protein
MLTTTARLGCAGQQVPLDLATADVDGIDPPLVFD